MVQHSLQHSGALGESVWVRRVNNEDEAVHFVIIFGPNSTEAFAATKIIDCHMIALVPGDNIIQIKNSEFVFVFLYVVLILH